MTRNIIVDTSTITGFPVRGSLVIHPMDSGSDSTATISDGAFADTKSVEELATYRFTLRSQESSAESQDVMLVTWIATVPTGTGDIALNELFEQSPFVPTSFDPGAVYGAQSANVLDFGDGVIGDTWRVGSDYIVHLG